MFVSATSDAVTSGSAGEFLESADRTCQPRPVPGPIRVLDLFAGAGGFSEGIGAVGSFDLVGAVEVDEDAAATFRQNHRGVCLATADIRSLSARDLLNLAGGRVDVVVAGPPCQGFSVSGPRDPAHPSTGLLFEAVRVIRELRPRAFLIENVPGLLSFRRGIIIDRLFRELGQIAYRGQKYSVTLETLDAVGYGVPQHRRRIFVSGVLGRPFEFPPAHSDRVSLIDAIGDLPEWTAGPNAVLDLPKAHPLTRYQRERRRGARALYNHSAKRLERVRQKRVASLQEGDDKRALPNHLQAGGRAGKYRKLRSGVPAPTVIAHMAHDTSGYIHPRYNRMLTVREAARLQGFDDRYRFCGSQYQQFKQVGNAVPPLLAAALGQALADSLTRPVVRIRSGPAGRSAQRDAC